MNTPIDWSCRVEAYLKYRRHLGFDLQFDETRLKSFARFAQDNGSQCLTLAISAEWARASRNPNPISWARRIEVLRGFASFCLRFDRQTVIPPRDLFGRAHRRLVPHIFTDDELRVLLDATDCLKSPSRLRSATCRTVFGLLAASGLRISEATELARADVDCQAGVLNIRQAKFHQARLVPLEATVTEQLINYAVLRDRTVTKEACNCFFVRDDGRPISGRSILYALQQICKQLGWSVRGDHPHHRLHDLRHTFIVRSVMQLYQQGKTIDQGIAALSIYVGHAKVTDTYWYMTGIPELMSLAGERFQQYANEVTT